MRLRLLALPIVLSLAAPAFGENAPALLRKYGCSDCHSMRAGVIAPGWPDVAASYAGKADASASIVAVIRNGAHNAGPVKMPRSPGITDADAKAIAAYILGAKK
jgi:cytochrome c